MKIAEGQKTQFIVLVCMVVFVFGFAIFKIVGSGSHAQTRQPQAVTKQADNKDAAPDKVVEVPTPPDAVVASDTAAAGDQSARDPFIPQIDVSKPRSLNVPNPVRNSIPPMISTGKLPGMSPLIPPMPFDRQIRVTSSGNTPAVQKQDEADPAKLFKLTGVIQGSVNVAILRGPDNARYIVREGQLIDGKYRVDLVSRFGVRLSFNNRSYLLSLGGSDAVKGAQ